MLFHSGFAQISEMLLKGGRVISVPRSLIGLLVTLRGGKGGVRAPPKPNLRWSLFFHPRKGILKVGEQTRCLKTIQMPQVAAVGTSVGCGELAGLRTNRSAMGYGENSPYATLEKLGSLMRG